jgi:hypothetical protein
MRRHQRGIRVRGSVHVVRPDSRLQVDLDARRSALRASLSARARAGRLTRLHLPAGRVRFSVRLNRRARRALRRRGRLALRVTISVTPPSGARFRAHRTVKLKP